MASHCRRERGSVSPGFFNNAYQEQGAASPAVTTSHLKRARKNSSSSLGEVPKLPKRKQEELAELLRAAIRTSVRNKESKCFLMYSCTGLSECIALVYNWWSLFTRLSVPNKRTEAITSRPLLLHAVGRKTSHSNQSTLTLTSLRAEANKIQTAMKAVAAFLGHVRSTTEQLKPKERWRLILLAATRAFPLTRALEMPFGASSVA